MALAHKIGEDKCTIFAQDISQRSNKMLKLNLILNSLVSSLDHAIQGDTLIAPYHNSCEWQELKQGTTAPQLFSKLNKRRIDYETEPNHRCYSRNVTLFE